MKDLWESRMIVAMLRHNLLYFLFVLWITIRKCNAQQDIEEVTYESVMNVTMAEELIFLQHPTTANLRHNTHKELPSSFDARNHWPYCKSIGDIKNQGSCKSGWAVAVASVITDRLCILKGKQVDDFSAYNLLSCCDDCCGCNGGIILNAWDYVKEEGLMTGGSYRSRHGCQPYMIRPCNGKNYTFNTCGWKSDEVPECLSWTCTNKKHPNQNANKYRIKDYVLLPRDNQELIMKELYFNGPIQVSMHLYDDFRSYKGGKYVRSSVIFEGDHAVKLIGWDDHKNWLLINSFGEKWGQNGTFSISRYYQLSNCDFGYAMVVPNLNSTRFLSINTTPPLACEYKLHFIIILCVLFKYIF